MWTADDNKDKDQDDHDAADDWTPKVTLKDV